MRLLKFTDDVINTIKFFRGMFRIISDNYQGRKYPSIARRALLQPKDDVPGWQMRIVIYLGMGRKQYERIKQKDSLKSKIKSAGAKLCSYLVIPVIACLFPLALALDSIDFAVQAIVEIAKAAVVIFTTITSPMPTAKVSNNNSENTPITGEENKADVIVQEKSNCAITPIRKRSQSQDSLFAPKVEKNIETTPDLAITSPTKMSFS